MKRTIACIILTLLICGCKGSSSPNLFAPYGPSRVPPPATGSVQGGGTYYQTPAQPPTVPPTGMGQRNTDLSPGNLQQAPTGQSAVQLAQRQQPVANGAANSQSSSLRSRLQPMRVNDATSASGGDPAMPQGAQPPVGQSNGAVDIGQLPNASPAPPVWPYRGSAVQPTSQGAPLQGAPTNAFSGTGPRLGWKSRPYLAVNSLP